uniref:Activin_recp domain-containing protein n=1 Tax=Meloidogyne hapla TaxID=6305 RepID=A0A1I8BQ53_MELHA
MKKILLIIAFPMALIKFSFCDTLKVKFNKIETKEDNQENNVNSTLQCYQGGSFGVGVKEIVDCKGIENCYSLSGSDNHTDKISKKLHMEGQKFKNYGCEKEVDEICKLEIIENSCGEVKYKGNYVKMCCCTSNLCNSAPTRSFLSPYILSPIIFYFIYVYILL